MINKSLYGEKNLRSICRSLIFDNSFHKNIVWRIGRGGMICGFDKMQNALKDSCSYRV